KSYYAPIIAVEHETTGWLVQCLPYPIKICDITGVSFVISVQGESAQFAGWPQYTVVAVALGCIAAVFGNRLLVAHVVHVTQVNREFGFLVSHESGNTGGLVRTCDRDFRLIGIGGRK